VKIDVLLTKINIKKFIEKYIKKCKI